MKARINIENITGIKEFNLEADIIPENGAGDITFENTIAVIFSLLTLWLPILVAILGILLFVFLLKNR